MPNATRFDYRRKKKNAEPYIIPASNFISVKKEQKQVIETQEHAHAKVDNVKDQKTPYKQDHNPPPVSNLNKVKSKAKPKAVSGLSLKSIDKKKELKQKKLQREENQPKKLNETFTESEALLAWDEYVLKLKNKGEKILASILETDRPSLKDKTLHITLPNSTMKVELERAQGPLISYIRNQVKNSFVDLSITVNEEVAKKYAFTTREKFDKLVQKNNNLEKLRRLFDLDIK